MTGEVCGGSLKCNNIVLHRELVTNRERRNGSEKKKYGEGVKNT